MSPNFNSQNCLNSQKVPEAVKYHEKWKFDSSLGVFTSAVPASIDHWKMIICTLKSSFREGPIHPQWVSDN